MLIRLIKDYERMISQLNECYMIKHLYNLMVDNKMAIFKDNLWNTIIRYTEKMVNKTLVWITFVIIKLIWIQVLQYLKIESYENFHKLKWCKVRKQLPSTYMEKFMSVPWTPSSMLKLCAFFIHHDENSCLSSWH